ncbi:hypothetical protein B0H10DRAFT_490118 [Mycena sp. CBHHK59/15]|nr:hypothetical protein B0H10DRAFT_490118 [Mycena sp. CBHHK59/15]
MARSANTLRTNPSSDGVLSSLEDLDLHFPPVPPSTGFTTDAPRDPSDVHDDEYRGGAESHEPLITFFIQIAVMLHAPQIAKNADVCKSVQECLRTIPEVAVTSVDYVPPKESTWGLRRRALEESLLKNLRKYIRFSDHLVRKPPSTEELHRELDKLQSFAEKFFHLSMKLRASTEKIRLMELCDMYNKLKLSRLEDRQLRELSGQKEQHEGKNVSVYGSSDARREGRSPLLIFVRHLGLPKGPPFPEMKNIGLLVACRCIGASMEHSLVLTDSSNACHPR